MSGTIVGIRLIRSAHLQRSIEEHGFYRNVVIANDGTILAGHGVVEAAHEAGLTSVPVIRLPIAPDDPRALKILTGDNELGRLAEIDDRLLSELLKQIRDEDTLLGTGYDDQMLANLIFVTRPASEIGSMDEAAAWLGMPAFDSEEQPYRLLISFETEADRASFMQTAGVVVKGDPTRKAMSCWFPERERDDASSLRFSQPDAA